MLIIPSDKLDEWNSEYDRLQQNKQISRVSFLAHCAAAWGYNQGLTAMNHLFNIDPELE
jgi:hypothetical protein